MLINGPSESKVIGIPGAFTYILYNYLPERELDLSFRLANNVSNYLVTEPLPTLDVDHWHICLLIEDILI